MAITTYLRGSILHFLRDPGADPDPAAWEYWDDGCLKIVDGRVAACTADGHAQQVHAVVLRAAGERAFSAGLDIKSTFGQPENVWNHEDPGEYLSPKWQKVWKPVVCAVQGMCTAGGFYFVNESDVVLCSHDATFFDSHVTGGMVSALEPVGLMRRIGLGAPRLGEDAAHASVRVVPLVDRILLRMIESQVEIENHLGVAAPHEEEIASHIGSRFPEQLPQRDEFARPLAESHLPAAPEDPNELHDLHLEEAL